MWRCPKCKANIRIFGARVCVEVSPHGSDVVGDVEWEDHDKAECTSCDWTGTAAGAYAEEVI